MRLVGVGAKTLPLAPNGWRCLVVAADYRSRFPFSRELTSNEARPIADFLFEEVFRFRGFVRYVVSDDGNEFRNKAVWELLSEHLGRILCILRK